MNTSGSYFVSKFGWREGWENDYNNIVLLDRPQDFTNKDYWELSRVLKDNPQSQLLEGMHRMFLLAPDECDVGGRFNKFWKSIPHKKVSQDLTEKKQDLTEMSIILMVLTKI